jgi:hypothetical protein
MRWSDYSPIKCLCVVSLFSVTFGLQLILCWSKIFRQTVGRTCNRWLENSCGLCQFFTHTKRTVYVWFFNEIPAECLRRKYTWDILGICLGFQQLPKKFQADPFPEKKDQTRDQTLIELNIRWRFMFCFSHTEVTIYTRTSLLAKLSTKITLYLKR